MESTMSKGKAGTVDAKNQCMQDRGTRKNMNAGLRSPITRMSPSDYTVPSEKTTVNGKIQVTCDDVSAPHPAQKNLQTKRNKNQLSGSGLQQSQLTHLQLLSPWNVS